MRNIDPDSEENQEATRDNQRAVFAAKMQAKADAGYFDDSDSLEKEPHPEKVEVLGPMERLVDSFGKRLRALRLASRLTQQEVADRSGLHVTAICHFESNADQPTPPVNKTLPSPDGGSSDVRGEKILEEPRDARANTRLLQMALELRTLLRDKLPDYSGALWQSVIEAADEIVALASRPSQEQQGNFLWLRGCYDHLKARYDEQRRLILKYLAADGSFNYYHASDLYDTRERLKTALDVRCAEDIQKCLSEHVTKSDSASSSSKDVQGQATSI